MVLKKLFLSLALAGFFVAADAATPVNKFGKDTEVCDPVLIYTGGLSKRATWNEMNLKPYVTHLYADGHRDWFYDAFIFNETNWYDASTRETRVLCNAGAGQLPATKADWTAFLNKIFATATDMGALDKLIGKMKASLGEPRLRHKVIIGMCYPCKDGRGTPGACSWKKFDWGQIDGVDMDFSRADHRVAACKWYIDEAIRRFDETGYENIDLAGFYCTEETLYTIGDFVGTVNDYIKSKGFRSYWIPYWTNNDQYALEWNGKYKFDMTYRQPNYFFYTNNGKLPSKSQLNACIRSCKQFGLGLELEFETSGTSNGLHEVSPDMHQRLIDYIDAFETNNVWLESGVAHYSGSQGFIDLVKSNDPVNLATVDRLCDIVIARQKAFAGVGGIDAPEIDNDADAPVEYYNLQGVRVANPGKGFYIRKQGSKVTKVAL